MSNDYNNMYSNFNRVSRYAKYLYIISFVIQWSILMMILNIVTLYLLRIPLFILFIIDALTMIHRPQKSIRRPSYILTHIWNFIDSISDPQSRTHDVLMTIESYIRKFCYRIENIYARIRNALNNFRLNQNKEQKYNRERDLNKFSSKIGSKVTVESIKPGGKIEKKSFKYKDRAISYVNLLKSNGYKDYTQYNVDLNQSPAYIVVNKNRDLIDLELEDVKMFSTDKHYNLVVDGWPKK